MPHVEDVLLRADPGGGYLSLSARLRGGHEVTARMLSDGELSWLWFVGTLRLAESASLLVFDEPDHHLDPAMLAYAVDLLTDLSERVPVILTTHSDRLLDLLYEPAEQVVVCERTGDQATRLRRLDPDGLAAWRQEYDGLGRIRAAGLLPEVIAR